MKPIEFPEQNKVFAKNQPEYIPLPGHLVDDTKGEFIFCMHLSFFERIKLLITGKLWCSLLTFNQPLTPSFFTTSKIQVFGLKLNSWLGYLNYYFLQFLWIRIAKHEQEDGKSWYSIMYWVKPRTGWTRNYKTFGHSGRLVNYLPITSKF